MTKEPKILYEDASILVCHKQPGMALQSDRSTQPDLERLLKYKMTQAGKAPYVGIVTRLDQPVEGLIVFAKTKQAAAALSKSQQQGIWTKEYLAAVDGMPPEAGELVDWLLRDGRSNTSRVVSEGTKGAKRARLSYRLAKTDPEHGQSLLCVKLDTGRHHHIRVQLAHAGWSVFGVKKYGRQTEGYQPLALCCAHLVFPHPESGKQMTYMITPEGTGFLTFSDTDFARLWS